MLGIMGLEEEMELSKKGRMSNQMIFWTHTIPGITLTAGVAKMTKIWSLISSSQVSPGRQIFWQILTIKLVGDVYNKHRADTQKEPMNYRGRIKKAHAEHLISA